MRDLELADKARTGQLWPVCAYAAGGGHGAVLPRGTAGYLPGHDHSVVVVELWGHLYCAPVRQVKTVVVVPFDPHASTCGCGYGDETWVELGLAGGAWVELGQAGGASDSGCHHLFQAEVNPAKLDLIEEIMKIRACAGSQQLPAEPAPGRPFGRRGRPGGWRVC